MIRLTPADVNVLPDLLQEYTTMPRTKETVETGVLIDLLPPPEITGRVITHSLRS